MLLQWPRAMSNRFSRPADAMVTPAAKVSVKSDPSARPESKPQQVPRPKPTPTPHSPESSGRFSSSGVIVFRPGGHSSSGHDMGASISPSADMNNATDKALALQIMPTLLTRDLTHSRRWLCPRGCERNLAWRSEIFLLWRLTQLEISKSYSSSSWVVSISNGHVCRLSIRSY